MILNQKVPVVKMIPLISRLPRGGGQDAMVTRPPPFPPPWTLSLTVLKKMLVQFRSFANERYCLQLKIIVTFRRHASFIIKALCLVDSSDIYK